MKKDIISRRTAYDIAVFMHKAATKGRMRGGRLVTHVIRDDEKHLWVEAQAAFDGICISTFFGSPTVHGGNINESEICTPEDFYKIFKLMKKSK